MQYVKSFIFVIFCCKYLFFITVLNERFFCEFFLQKCYKLFKSYLKVLRYVNLYILNICLFFNIKTRKSLYFVAK